MMSELLLFTCVACRFVAAACPECVTSIRIDPTTGLPPGVTKTARGDVLIGDPTDAQLARAVREPLCDNCVERRHLLVPQEPKAESSDQRHRRGFCRNW